ncbi:PREDICTED: putative F-box protein At2g19630 [Camelina sativa]|uniref:F-box protein At2g19630 n=1 Tax=Camelina sativa TaxID=90675 RepID=A0ABM0T1F1_CAMSA|nr:PREDICTED: putative F-box protein At2g19630 [Camelina sativa]
MKSEQQNVSEEDLVAVTGRNTRAKTSSNGGGEPIPVDLIVEICSRLPTKSISRCRCVSKLWASIPRLPYFTELFLTRSLARPKLLFACRKDSHVFFFSSPQPHQILADDNNSSVLAASYHMKIPNYHKCIYLIRSSVRGLMLVEDMRGSEGKERKVSVICNPNTGQSVTLPKLKTRKRFGMRSFLGYEPIEKLYKVLSMAWGVRSSGSEDHQVLTLGTGGESSWTRVECCIPHSVNEGYYVDHVCIDGVLYYQAFHTSSRDYIIVLFDLRSEKFRFVENSRDPLNVSLFCWSPLINYNGKLGSLGTGIHPRSTNIRLRVLEDAEKHEWSEHTYVLPASWTNTVGGPYRGLSKVVGLSRSNEIVFLNFCKPRSVYILYYSTERNAIRSVEIQGLEAFKGYSIYTYLGHVEDVNVKLIEGFL